jgi:hypothetical protein
MKQGYGKIEQNDIGEQLCHFPYSFFAVNCFAANHPISRIFIEQVFNSPEKYFRDLIQSLPNRSMMRFDKEGLLL